MKCRIIFSRVKEEKYFNILSAEMFTNMLKVNTNTVGQNFLTNLISDQPVVQIWKQYNCPFP